MSESTERAAAPARRPEVGPDFRFYVVGLYGDGSNLGSVYSNDDTYTVGPFDEFALAQAAKSGVEHGGNYAVCLIVAEPAAYGVLCRALAAAPREEQP